MLTLLQSPMVGLDECCENFNDRRDELEFDGKKESFFKCSICSNHLHHNHRSTVMVWIVFVAAIFLFRWRRCREINMRLSDWLHLQIVNTLPSAITMVPSKYLTLSQEMNLSLSVDIRRPYPVWHLMREECSLRPGQGSVLIPICARNGSCLESFGTSVFLQLTVMYKYIS